VLLILGCAAGLPGCTSWENLPLLPSLGIGHIADNRVRVTRSDSTHLVLVSPRVTGDTLQGMVEGHRERLEAIPLSGVQEIAVRKPDVLKTLALVVSLLVLCAVVMFSLAFGQGLWEWYGEINEIE
jgi:hypothetical protein